MAGIEDLWGDFGFTPNPNQERAIRHLDGPLYLPAGPGSGKTRVLLWRTVNLISFHGVRPEEIFLSTFTEKAAHQLREGLRILLAAASNRTAKPYDTARMYVGTVHSLCQKLLADRRFYPDRERGRPPILLDELGQYLHVSRRRLWKELLAAADFGDEPEGTIAGYLGKASRSRHEAITRCLTLFNRLSEECVDPEWAITQAQDETFHRLLRMYSRYRATLTERGVRQADFSLLQQFALSLLEASDAASRVFCHVIVDEYQDTNTVQERIFFRLAAGHKNICVVGDDDQALYRFRGATVENFVDFPRRCVQALTVAPLEIPLDTNYRSRPPIVRWSRQFLDQCDWTKTPPETGSYRVTSKRIEPHRQDAGVAVVASTATDPNDVSDEIAGLVSSLVTLGKVQDPNQIAFLYPSLKSKHVERMQTALEARGLLVYAPRARTFLECPEATAMLGVFLHVFGRLARGAFPGEDYRKFHDWLDVAAQRGGELVAADERLARFVADRVAELERAAADFGVLSSLVAREGWVGTAPYEPARMKRALVEAARLSDAAKRTIRSRVFDQIVEKRQAEGRPFPLEYILKRATSIDWSLLDLFYRCCGFGHFIAMFDAAQRAQNPDEGPVCNLGLLSQYLSRFMDQRAPIITGAMLQENGFQRLFFGSYLYALFRRGESEFEDANDPFPKGRIPFLTIHQAKGLEFPVVVLGNLRKDDTGPQRVEELVRPLLPLDRQSEPLDRLSRFDIMRMFYVALSRAENLVVLAHFKGRGQTINPEFRQLLGSRFQRIPEFDPSTLPAAKPPVEAAPRTYSYTADFLAYRRCPRQYLIFRRFDFAPSRSQTMLFGTLVHRTLDDLHQYLIARRKSA
jgi:ATP-dependent DNA helicase UvrD/PcrA